MKFFALLLFVGTLMMAFLGLRMNRKTLQVQGRIAELRQQRVDFGFFEQKKVENDFQKQVILPMAQLVFDKTQTFIPLGNKSWVKSKLMQAGYQKPHHPKVFLGIQLLFSVGLFGLLSFFTILFGKVSGAMETLIALGFGLAGYGFPMIWLLQQAQKRQKDIQKSLADFLDLLVICVEAGLSMDVAIQKIITMRSGKTASYLHEELEHYMRDIGLGRPRKDALLDLAERSGVEDFNSIINALVQSYEMGNSVSQTLRVQADSLRTKRLTKAEEKANKIPVKMVIPIYVFLFPAIFVCIFGPIGMIMFQAVMKIFNNTSSLNH